MGELGKILSTGIEPIDKRANLGEIAYSRLCESIARGAFSPNQKLTVRSIAHALGVSTTPARDALNRLLAEGALINAGPKTVIIPPLTRENLEEVTILRLNLEGLAAELAARHLTDEDVRELEMLQGRINKGLDDSDYASVLSANRAFHFLIYRKSGLPRLVSMIEPLWLQIGPSLNALYPAFAQNRRGVSNHMTIFDGIASGDGKKVRQGIEQDIRDGFDSLSAFLDGFQVGNSPRISPKPAD